ncbi:MAG: hypothetical protein KF896_12485 [Ignavibacteriae bacterium]|nr:hypothetical protein [Ignavibacteriota bacterium]
MLNVKSKVATKGLSPLLQKMCKYLMFLGLKSKTKGSMLTVIKLEL